MTIAPHLQALTARLDAAVSPPAGVHFVHAPGRVNLIGDHTDYQDGFCLPMAIDRELVIGWRPHADGRVVVRSLDLGGEVNVPADGSADLRTVEPAWGRIVGAVLRVLSERDIAVPGLEAAVVSSVPIGSGLSSSAASSVGTTYAFSAAAGAPLAGRDLALAAQSAEQVATGVPCGVLDQMSSVFGRAGHALLLDCRSLDVEPLALPAGQQVLVVHSGLPRILAGSEYAQRRAACEAAAARLGLAALRDATVEVVADDPFARHVVSENARTLAFADALRAGHVTALGPLMLASHASLRDDYRVSTPELDALVELACEAGATGARLTGAGFGGCVVALVPDGIIDEVAAHVVDRYRARTGLTASAFEAHAVAGAGSVTDP